MKKRSIPVLLLVISGLLRGQEPNKFLAYWNKPSQIVAPTPQREQATAIVFLQDASQFKAEGDARLAQASLNKDGSMTFYIVIKERTQVVRFNPRFNPDGKPKRGTFQLLTTMCGGPIYEFVKDSAAENQLLSFVRGALESLLAKEVQAPKATGGCVDVGGDTVATLAALFGHFQSAVNPK